MEPTFGDRAGTRRTGRGSGGWRARRSRRGPAVPLLLHTALAVIGLTLALLVWSIASAEPPGTPEGTAAPAGPDREPTQVVSPAPTAASATGREDRYSDRELLDPPEATTGAQEGPEAGRPSGESALRANPLYGTDRLAPRPCPAPNLDVEDPGSMEAFLNDVADCLDETWTTQFARAGIPFEPPTRVFWSEPGSSPCREYPSTAGAFYCRASTSIYIGTSDVVEKWGGETNGAVYAALLAHEYAHHVQGESGLLDYYHEQRRLETEVTEQNEWTRRSELQANCLAGAFLGAVAVSYPLAEDDRALLRKDAEATADRGDKEEERTHGTPENSVLWMERGLTEQRPGACNTWVAEPELVE